MKKMTEKALHDAFAGESMAHMKYLMFSDIAEKVRMPNVARLLKAIAYAEQVHATNHARNLKLVKENEENLQSCVDGENHEVEEMYPVFKKTAELQGEKSAEQSMHFALEAEKIHEKMFRDAKTHAAKGEDIDIAEVYICPVCGFTHIGKPPEFCPLCGAPSSKFRKF